MARRALSNRSEEEVELNMTPMLDVVFIMLIFFIVTAVFVKEPGIDVERPLVSNLDSVKPTIIVAVSSEDETWINKRLVDRSELGPTLEALRAENPLAEAIVQGDTHARFEDVYAVMQALQKAGIEVQTVSVEPR
jgi:biopolymer transport protein ExbD